MVVRDGSNLPPIQEYTSISFAPSLSLTFRKKPKNNEKNAIFLEFIFRNGNLKKMGIGMGIGP